MAAIVAMVIAVVMAVVVAIAGGCSCCYAWLMAIFLAALVV